MSKKRLRAFEIGIGWRSQGHYDPKSEWFLGWFFTPNWRGKSFAQCRATLVGFYILICLYSDKQTKADNNG